MPKYLGRYVSTILLIIFVPIIFLTTQIVRYDIWVEQVAENEKLSFNQAELIINSFLSQRVGNNGIYGFYLYTAEFPVLPDRKVEINNLSNEFVVAALSKDNFSEFEKNIKNIDFS